MIEYSRTSLLNCALTVSSVAVRAIVSLSLSLMVCLCDARYSAPGCSSLCAHAPVSLSIEGRGGRAIRCPLCLSVCLSLHSPLGGLPLGRSSHFKSTIDAGNARQLPLSARNSNSSSSQCDTCRPNDDDDLRPATGCILNVQCP